MRGNHNDSRGSDSRTGVAAEENACIQSCNRNDLSGQANNGNKNCIYPDRPGSADDSRYCRFTAAIPVIQFKMHYAEVFLYYTVSMPQKAPAIFHGHMKQGVDIPMTTNIMVVDDEKSIADLIELYLTNEDYNVLKFGSGQEALKCVEEERLDLAILDVMLPDMDGFTICQRIRRKHFFPIIMLTARVEDIDKIKGLTLGADDYMTKPFNPLELVARVKTQLRRYMKYNSNTEKENPVEPNNEFDFAGLVINRDSHKCTLYGKPLSLTPIEFSILWYLCENRGKVISTEELFEAVWGEKYLDNNNTVMAHIARLREKMNEPSRKPKFVKTVWGVGYTIE